MRLYLIAFRFTVLLQYAHLGMAEIEAERSPLCVKIQEEGPLKPEQAKSIVGPWAQGQFDEWKAADPGGHFWTWLHRKWAPDAADSIIDCKLSRTCSPVTCRLIDDQHDIEDQWSAYWTLESLTTFHNMAYEIKDAHEKAWLSVRGEIGTIMGTFSDGSNIEKHKAKHDRNWKIASHFITTIAMLLSAISVFLSALIGLEAITLAISAEAIRMIGSTGGLFGTVATSALNFGTDMMETKDYVSKTTNMLLESQKINQDRIVDRFDAYMLDLLSGKSDRALTNSRLVHLVQQGRYASSSSVFTPEINQALRQQWVASYVSSIWNLEGTYIVMANTRNCESDSRGFKPLRVCLEEAPEYVFYTFSKSVVREGTNHKAYIRGPIGHKKLKAQTGFTLKDAVRASYVYSKRNGYSVSSGAPESEDMVDSFFGPKSLEAGGKAHGLFNIPILYSPKGQAISSINSRNNRNYPCMGAALPWSKKKHNHDSSLEARHDEKWTDNDPKTMFQFLNATGFYKSGDWWGYCHGARKHHGNHCRGNEDVNWEGKFGSDQYHKLHHPFKKCKGRGHGFTGCERPNNNGYDKNRPSDCGGKHNMAEGYVAEGDTQWFNETALELGDSSDDEGDLSDWTDDEDEGDDNLPRPTSRGNGTSRVSQLRA
ncbi:hypothetical protein KCU98_g4706, partial [Aureobasidium melanogenum]